jgi:ParB/RepB/Spo0J family partition protein
MRARVPVDTRRAEQPRVAQQSDRGKDGAPLLIRVDQIDPNPRNPRRVFNEDALNELAESIKQWNQLQPIVVRRIDDRYELICGERRWRAHQRAGLPTIWAVEREASDADAYALALVENIQRVDLSHAEKVAALDQLGELAQGGGLRRTARSLHMSPGWLSVQLSLRKDPVIYPALETGRVSFGQAAALLRAPAHARQALLDQTLRKRAGIADIQAWVRAARRQERSSGAEARGGVLDVLQGALRQLNALGPPTLQRERTALRAIRDRAEQLLAQPASRPEPPVERPAGRAGIRTRPARRRR